MATNCVHMVDGRRQGSTGTETDRHKRKVTRATPKYYKKRQKLTPEQHEIRRRALATKETRYLNNEKFCNHCATLKPLTAFYPKRTHDGVSAYCSACDRERTRRNAERRRANDPSFVAQRRAHSNTVTNSQRDEPRRQERAQLLARIRYGVMHLRTVNRMTFYEIAFVLGVTEVTLRKWLVKGTKSLRETILIANDRLTAFLDAEKDLTKRGISPIPALVCARADVVTPYRLSDAYDRARAYGAARVMYSAMRRSRLRLDIKP